MKAKVLLSTMVLAAAFAGCSQDEWSENSINTSNDNRRTVGEVVLSLSNPDTRMDAVMGENGMPSFVFSATDKVGAHLMDQFMGKYPITTLTNNINTNYPFQQEGGEWKSTGVLSEGNYFFSYPFDGCQQDRGALTNTVPVEQYAYPRDEEGNQTGDVAWYQSYLDNQFYLGYNYLAAEECEDCDEVGVLNAGVRLEPVHAYPLFEFVNMTGAPQGKPMKVFKISLRKADESMFYNTVAVFPRGKEFNRTVDPSEYTLWRTAVYNRNMGDRVEAWPLNAKEICKSQTLEYNLHFPEDGYAVENWDSFKACMIVPAGLYGNMQVLIYTDLGIFKTSIIMPNDMVDSGTWKFTPNKAPKFTIKGDICEIIDNANTFTVQSTENLVEYLKYIAEIGNPTKVAVRTVGDKVELSKEAYAILENENMKLELNGTLVIPADVPEDAIDRINFYKKNNRSRIINLGTQVITERPIEDKFGRNDVNVRIYNYGQLTLKADMPISFIANFKELNVENSAVYALINIGKTTVNKELDVIQLINMGDMVVNEGAGVNILSKWFNYGHTENNGRIETYPADWSNPDFISDLVEWTGWGKWTPILDGEVGAGDNEIGWRREAALKVYEAFIAASAEAVNLGTIDNKGTIDSNGFILRNSTNDEVVKKKVIEVVEGRFKVYLEELSITTNAEWAAVTSLVNYGSNSVINNYGSITNLSNFGMLIAQPKQEGATTASYTWLVDMDAKNLEKLGETQEAAEYYLQDPLGFFGIGLIDMSENDGVKLSDQAVLNDNENKVLESDQQIIFVKRSGKADFFVDTNENAATDTHKSAPNYINTIWFENATATITGAEGENSDISDKMFWMTGKNAIAVEKNRTLKLGSVYMDGENTFTGAGEVQLCRDIFVNSGKFNSVVKLIAENYVKVFGNTLKKPAINLGNTWDKEHIEISEASFSDYVGPWIVINYNQN